MTYNTISIGSEVEVVEVIYNDGALLTERSVFLHRTGTVIAKYIATGPLYKVEFEGSNCGGVWFASEELEVVGDSTDESIDDGSTTTQELLSRLMK